MRVWDVLYYEGRFASLVSMVAAKALSADLQSLPETCLISLRLANFLERGEVLLAQFETVGEVFVAHHLVVG